MNPKIQITAKIRAVLRKRRPRNTTWVISDKFPPVRPQEHINHFGVSGGKDSTALLLWALFESGYPRESLDVSFCDTGNESPITYDYLRYLEHTLHIGITWIKPELDFFALAKRKKRFPSSKARFCTEELKIIPTTDYITATRGQCKTLTLHSGVRALESDERSKLPPESYDARFMAVVKRPLLTWTISNVWGIHERYKVKPNPLYAMGMVRVGCFPCVMSRKEEIRRIAKLCPEVFDKIRKAEIETNANRSFSSASFFHSSTVPKAQRSGPTFKRTTSSGAGGKGSTYQIATIDDIIRWASTARGGIQQAMHFDDVVNYEKLPMGETSRSCPSSLGMCE